MYLGECQAEADDEAAGQGLPLAHAVGGGQQGQGLQQPHLAEGGIVRVQLMLESSTLI